MSHLVHSLCALPKRIFALHLRGHGTSTASHLIAFTYTFRPKGVRARPSSQAAQRHSTVLMKAIHISQPFGAS